MKRRYDACRFIRVERWRVFYKRHSVWMRFFSLIQFNCCFSLQRFLKIGVMTCLHDFEVFPLQQLNFKISTGKLFVKNDFARSILFKRGKSLQNLLQILRCYQSNSSNSFFTIFINFWLILNWSSEVLELYQNNVLVINWYQWDIPGHLTFWAHFGLIFWLVLYQILVCSFFGTSGTSQTILHIPKSCLVAFQSP